MTRWRYVLDVNVIGVMVTFQAAARAMAAHGRGGRLLALSSVAAVRGERDTAAYATGNAGARARQIRVRQRRGRRRP